MAAYQACQSVVYTKGAEDMYHFEGCLTKFRNKINENKEIVIWVAIAALLALVNMLRYYSSLTSI